MFDRLLFLYEKNSDSVNAVAATLTIILFLHGVWGWLARRKRKLFASVSRAQIVPDVHMGDVRVRVDAFGSSGHALYKDVLLVVNKTDITITDADFAERLCIPRKSQGTVYSYSVIESENSGRMDLEETPEGISARNVMIPRGMGAIAEIYHDGCLMKDVSAITRTLGDVERYRPKVITNRLIYRMGFSNLLFFAVCFSSYLILRWVDVVQNITTIVAAVVMLCICYLALSVGLEFYLSNPRRNRGLGLADIEARFLEITQDYQEK